MDHRAEVYCGAPAAAAAIGAPAPTIAQTTVRAVMHSDVKILDPIWTTAKQPRLHHACLATAILIDELYIGRLV